jgi:hypothetical protein
MVASLTTVEAAQASLDEAFARTRSSPHGLDHTEAAQRLRLYGPNELPAEEDDPLWKKCGWFFTPLYFLT